MYFEISLADYFDPSQDITLTFDNRWRLAQVRLRARWRSRTVTRVLGTPTGRSWIAANILQIRRASSVSIHGLAQNPCCSALLLSRELLQLLRICFCGLNMGFWGYGVGPYDLVEAASLTTAVSIIMSWLEIAYPST